MGLYLHFCLILVDYLILFGVEMLSELTQFLRLKMLLGSAVRKIV